MAPLDGSDNSFRLLDAAIFLAEKTISIQAKSSRTGRLSI